DAQPLLDELVLRALRGGKPAVRRRRVHDHPLLHPLGAVSGRAQHAEHDGNDPQPAPPGRPGTRGRIGDARHTATLPPPRRTVIRDAPQARGASPVQESHGAGMRCRTTTVRMIEGGAPSTLFRRGFARDMVKPGTENTIEGYRAKNGANRANGRDL